jgi:hypothetical protein
LAGRFGLPERQGVNFLSEGSSRKAMACPPNTPISRGPGLTGPVILIAIGVVFLIGEFVPQWGVRKTWPVLLIVLGILKLLDSRQ